MSDKKPGAAAPKKSNKMVIIAAVAVLVLGGGGGAFWWHTRSVSAEGEGEGGHGEARHESKHDAKEEGGGLVPLEPFIVNLSGSHYLRTTLKIVVADEHAAEKLTKNEVAVTRMRSAILELLSQQTAERLVTADGKSELKTAIAEHISPLTGGVKVSDVLFSDFVVQF